jgi:hypothetical protein
MWVETLRPHVGGVSLLRYALNFLVVIAAALLWAITFSANTYAADASWNQSGTIRYNNQDYQGPKTADGKIPPGLAQGVQYYEHITPETGQGSKARILALPAGVDPKDTTQLQYSEYDYDRGASDAQKYTNGTSARQLTIDKQPANTGQKEETSCVVGGVGFIVCPIMNLLAEAMDKVYEVLKTFLNVTPLSMDRENGLFKAWQLMLAFANILFVIGFLVIIYSYVSSQGVSQYDLRSIIPRLIVAAVLINASYYICALAVDASNVMGASLQDVFNNIRKDLAGNDVTSEQAWATSWQNLTTIILSGGTMGAAGLLALSSYGAASLHLLMPMLIAAVIAVLVAVVILAVRQALITILIILAPIAFAAFILPSTQKYFDKWKDVFMTMLVMYPMFAVLFGGSQLAATMIAQNASNILVIMLAMFVQVAPLVLTPFLIKFSGSLLGRIAGMVNNPAKGLGDRAKNWSTGRLDHAKNRRLQEQNKGWKRTPGLALAKSLDSKKRKREGQLERYKAARNAQYAAESDAQAEHIATKRAKAAEEAATHTNDSLYEAAKFANSDLKRESANNVLAEKRLHNNKARWDNYLAEIESEKGRLHHVANGDTTAAMLGNALHAQGLDHAAQDRRKEMAAQEHRSEIADAMMQDAGLKAEAAGISGQKGEAIVMAQAVVDKRADFGKGVSAIKEMERHFRLSGKEVEDIAMRTGGPVTKTDSNGNSYTFDYNNDHAFEAAVDILINEKGSYAQKMALLEKSAEPEYAEVRTTLVDGVKKSMLSAAPQLGGQSLDIIGTTGIAGPSGADKLTRGYVVKAKMSQEALATMDSDNAKVFIRALSDPTNFDGVDRTKRLEYQTNRAEVIRTAREALANPRLEGVIKKNLRAQLEQLGALREY